MGHRDIQGKMGEMKEGTKRHIYGGDIGVIMGNIEGGTGRGHRKGIGWTCQGYGSGHRRGHKVTWEHGECT